MPKKTLLILRCQTYANMLSSTFFFKPKRWFRNGTLLWLNGLCRYSTLSAPISLRTYELSFIFYQVYHALQNRMVEPKRNGVSLMFIDVLRRERSLIELIGKPGEWQFFVYRIIIWFSSIPKVPNKILTHPRCRTTTIFELNVLYMFPIFFVSPETGSTYFPAAYSKYLAPET